MYDVTELESFHEVDGWVKEIRKYASENIGILLIGNKADLEDKRKVSYEQGKEVADKYNMKFMEVSAKSGLNVEGMFSAIVSEVEKTMPGSTDGSSKNSSAAMNTRFTGTTLSSKRGKSNGKCC